MKSLYILNTISIISLHFLAKYFGLRIFACELKISIRNFGNPLQSYDRSSGRMTLTHFAIRLWWIPIWFWLAHVRIFLISILFLVSFDFKCNSQKVEKDTTIQKQAGQSLDKGDKERKDNYHPRPEGNSSRIMFYNVENLFDTIDDPLKNDNEFLPNGDKRWTSSRYRMKLLRIYKVITAVGEGQMPDIVGLCEVENQTVLNDLTNFTPLIKYNYKAIHYESPDERGIDVALLYREKNFTPLYSKPIPINFSPTPKGAERPTRDILYVKGLLKSDTLHIFVNHWPSRRGGQLESEPKRIFTASILRKTVDSLFSVNINPKIIIMGDLNDYPTDRSITEELKAKTVISEPANNSELYNMSVYYSRKDIGTYKYQGYWGILDQIIVSGALLNKEEKIYTTKFAPNIYCNDFLLDDKYLGKQPLRTYSGWTYLNGFSDHLPVYIDVFWEKK